MDFEGKAKSHDNFDPEGSPDAEEIDAQHGEAHEQRENPQEILRQLGSVLERPCETEADVKAITAILLDFERVNLRWSPNFFNRLPLSEKLKALRDVSRHPIANDIIYDRFAGELTYEVNFHSSIRERLFTREKDAIEQCADMKFVSNLVSHDDGYNERGRGEAYAFLAELADDGSPLERASAEIALRHANTDDLSVSRVNIDRRPNVNETTRTNALKRDAILTTMALHGAMLSCETEVRAISADSVGFFAGNALSRVVSRELCQPIFEQQSPDAPAAKAAEVLKTLRETRSFGAWRDACSLLLEKADLDDEFLKLSMAGFVQRFDRATDYEATRGEAEYDEERHRRLVADIPKDMSPMAMRKIQTALEKIIDSAPKVTLAAKDARIALAPLGNAQLASALELLHEPTLQGRIESELGAELNDLTLREQNQLLPYLLRTDDETFSKLTEKSRAFGINYLKMFLAGEEGASFLAKAHEVIDGNPEEAETILAAFSEITDLAQQSAATIGELAFKGGAVSAELADETRENLLGRARDIFRAKNPGKIALRLKELGAETSLFASICKTLKNNDREIDFGELRGVVVDTARPSDLTEDEKTDMRRIFIGNWREQKPEELAELTKGFGEVLEGSRHTTFHLLRQNGKIVGFVRFDDRPDLGENHVYGGSLNIDSTLRGSAIGEALMAATIDQAAKSHPIDADVFPELLVGPKYVNDYGCVITGTKNGRLTLLRNDQLTDLYSGKSDASLSELRNAAEVKIVTLDLRDGSEEFLAAIQTETDNGLVATRYFADTKEPNVRTFVFEPRRVTEQIKQAA